MPQTLAFIKCNGSYNHEQYDFKWHRNIKKEASLT